MLRCAQRLFIGSWNEQEALLEPEIHSQINFHAKSTERLRVFCFLSLENIYFVVSHSQAFTSCKLVFSIRFNTSASELT